MAVSAPLTCALLFSFAAGAAAVADITGIVTALYTTDNEEPGDLPGHYRAKPQLPSGWRSTKDPASGNTYYYNEETRETTWKHPGERKKPQEADVKSERSSLLAASKKEPQAVPAVPSSPEAKEAAIRDSGCRTDQHGASFFGKCFCRPGYEAPDCTFKAADINTINPWYTADCPNLAETETYRNDTTEFGKATNCPMPTAPHECWYLCYAHKQSGLMEIPFGLWERAQGQELQTWQNVKEMPADGDRVQEHKNGFGSFQALPKDLGNMVEVGSGPFSQTYFLLKDNPQFKASHVTLVEPNAERYMSQVWSCTYKSGKLDLDVPSTIVANPGEAFASGAKFDTLLATNVIEHVMNGYEYLKSLHRAIKPGGTLIFHERWFDNPPDGDCVLKSYMMHPIRVSKEVLDTFLTAFDILYKSEVPAEEMAQRNAAYNCNEKAMWVIAKKKAVTANQG